jgi:cyclase
VRTVRLRENIYVILGAGGNITVQTGADGVLVVNSGATGFESDVLATLCQISDEPLRRILLTGAEPHLTGGNAVLYRAGRFIGGRGEQDTAQISAHESVLTEMSSGEQTSTDSSAWPQDVYFTAHGIELYFNGEAVILLPAQNAVSAGNSIVYFRKSDVISAGDVFLQSSYPRIDAKRGGSLPGVIDALNKIIDLAIPAENQEGGTLIVSGDGRSSDEYELVTYRDMLTVFKDRIAHHIAAGKSLAQIQAAGVTQDYDGRYGADKSWSPRQFVEAAYLSMINEGHE